MKVLIETITSRKDYKFFEIQQVESGKIIQFLPL